MLGDKVVTMSLGRCPFLDRKCLGDKCALWERYDREDGTRVESCTFVMQSKLMAQQVVESMRVQASSDKVATNVHLGFKSLMGLAARAREVNSLGE